MSQSITKYEPQTKCGMSRFKSNITDNPVLMVCYTAMGAKSLKQKDIKMNTADTDILKFITPIINVDT